jgi:hypothetical protein
MERPNDVRIFRRQIPTLLAGGLAAVLLSACGAGDGGAPPRSDPDEPVVIRPTDPPVDRTGPELVEPRPGMADIRARAWERVRGRGRELMVVFWSGIEPCYVLDSVVVEEKPDLVTITLYEGHDPDKPDAVCIEIAVLKMVEVTLERPLGDRRVIDGAQS